MLCTPSLKFVAPFDFFNAFQKVMLVIISYQIDRMTYHDSIRRNVSIHKTKLNTVAWTEQLDEMIRDGDLAARGILRQNQKNSQTRVFSWLKCSQVYVPFVIPKFTTSWSSRRIAFSSNVTGCTPEGHPLNDLFSIQNKE